MIVNIVQIIINIDIYLRTLSNCAIDSPCHKRGRKSIETHHTLRRVRTVMRDLRTGSHTENRGAPDFSETPQPLFVIQLKSKPHYERGQKIF